jgi:hypothetical protein
MSSVRMLLTSLAAVIFITVPFAASSAVVRDGADGDILRISRRAIVVGFADDIPFEHKAVLFAREPLLAPLEADDVLTAPVFLRDRTVIARLRDGADEALITDLCARLATDPAIRYANALLVSRDGTEHGITDRFVVALRNEADLAMLEEDAARAGARIAEAYPYQPNVHILVVSPHAARNARDLAEAFAASDRYAWAEPDYLRLMVPHAVPNDPFFPSQWALRNTGTYFGGTPGADMNVENAWNVTTGDTTIRVAVLDVGVDLTHPDLVANMLPGYDGAGLGSGGAPSGNDAHGTACAGIIAAVGDNGIGIAGVAYESSILPVRIGYTTTGNQIVTTNTILAACIDWAWMPAHGNADVLSNSWGGGTPATIINTAIDNATTLGRGGRGALVLFSTGNSNTSVAYPASYASTIAVGATSNCDERKSPTSCDGETWGGNYGTNLDISAPGVKIYTTDIADTLGYASGDYLPAFNGTSSACPNAAGVAALILAVNPALRQSDARRILESTCDKVGGYTYNASVAGQGNGTWSADLGYGRVNAFAAVTAASASRPVVSTATPVGYSCIHPGMAIPISYTLSGIVVPGNVFSVQLSDSTGSFASPLVIGTKADTVSGTIACTIPANLVPASGYRLRVVTSAPASVGADNGSDLVIVALPTRYAVTGDGAYCNGTNGSEVGLSGSQPGVQYQLLLDGVAEGAPLAGTGAPLSWGRRLLVGDYSVLAFDPGTTCSVMMDDTLEVLIVPIPSVNQVAGQTLCAGTTTQAVTFIGGVPGTVFQWTNSEPGIGLAAADSGDIAAFTAVNTGTVPLVATITVTPVYRYGGATCTGTPIAFTFTVNPVPTVDAASDQTLCGGATTGAIAFAGPVAGTVFTWTNSNTSIGLGAAGVGDIAPFTAVNAGTVPLTSTLIVTPHYTNGGVTCTGRPDTLVLTVNPTPTVAAVQSQTVCAGAVVASTAFSGAVPGTVFSWTNSNTAIGLAAAGSGDLPSFTALNAGTVPVTATITVTPAFTNAGGTCTGTPISFTITVNPIPTVNAVAHQVLCSGESTTAVTFAGSVPGTVFTWTNSNTSIGLIASGSGNILSFLAVNNGPVPATSTITVTPTFTHNGVTCSGTPITYTYTVNPMPTVSMVTNKSLCDGGATLPIVFGGSATGAVYAWTNSHPSVGLAAAGTGDIPSFIATNADTVSVTATITVTPSFTASGVTCTGSPLTFTITVHPLPAAVITPLTATTICLTERATLEANGGVGYTYQWYYEGRAQVNERARQLTTTRAGTYTVLVTTANGCSRMSAPVTIVVQPAPNAAITALGETTICEGSSVMLEASDAPDYSWQWLLDGTPIAGATDRRVVASEGGVYTVRVTNMYGCSRTSPGLTVTLLPKPVAFLTLLSPATICTGGKVEMAAHEGASYTYRWLRNEQPIGVTTTTYAATQAGVYTVEVTGPNGCVAITNSITVTVKPMPTGVIAPTGPVALCAGDSIALTAEDIYAAVYTWKRGDEVIAGDGPRLVVRESGSYTYGVLTRDGCATTSNPVVVTVVPRPTAAVVPTGDAPVCAGSSLVLTTPAIAGAGYEWFRNGQPIANENGPTFEASVDGSYRVRVSIASCAVLSEETLVRVVPMPDATVSAVGSTTVCDGTEVELRAVSAAGLAYTWFRDGVQLAAASPTLRVTEAGAYTVRVETPEGCVSVSTEAVTVTVLPVPAAVVTPTGSIDVCDGDRVRLEALRADPATYQWLRDGAEIAGATALVYDVLESGAYQVRVTAAGGCVSLSNEVRVRVQEAPDVTIESSGAPKFCEGTDVTLRVPYQAGTTWQWYESGVAIDSARYPSLTVARNGSYSVRAVNYLGCERMSAVVEIEVLAKPNTEVTVLGGNRVLCSGRSVTIRATGGIGYSYQWLRNDTVLAGEVNRDLVVRRDGRYSVSVTTSSLCVGISEKVNITVLESVTVGAVTGPVTSPLGALARYTVAAPQSGFLYAWTVTGGLIRSGQTSPSIEVEWTTAGAGSVSVYATVDCSDTTRVAVAVDGTTSVDGVAAPALFELYPNPVDGDAVLALPSAARGCAHDLEVYDNLGRLVHAEQIAPGRALHRVSTASLAAGVYRVVLRAGAQRVFETMLVRR